MQMNETNVGVWNYKDQKFVQFIPCPGEKRVRLDVHDSLTNYGVFPGRWNGNMFHTEGPVPTPLTDWEINLS